MITAILFRNPNTEGPSVFLDLPASHWDVLEAKGQLQDNLSRCFYEFEPPDDLFLVARYLTKMQRGNQFVDELNCLSHQISQMDHADRILLEGAIAIHKPEDMTTLLNLTHHLDNILAVEAANHTELGHFLVDTGLVEFPEDVIPYLDFEKIGSEHQSRNTCTFANDVFYEDLASSIEPVYDTVSLPSPPKSSHIFKVTISGDDPDRSADLLLPAAENEMAQALEEIGISHYDDMNADIQVIHAESTIARFQRLVRPFDQCAEGLVLEALNELASKITTMDDDQYIKFLAVLEYNQDFNSLEIDIAEALDCAIDLDQYDLDSQVRASDVGSFGLIHHTGQVQRLEHTSTPQEPEMEMGGF